MSSFCQRTLAYSFYLFSLQEWASANRVSLISGKLAQLSLTQPQSMMQETAIELPNILQVRAHPSDAIMGHDMLHRMTEAWYCTMIRGMTKSCGLLKCIEVVCSLPLLTRP